MQRTHARTHTHIQPTNLAVLQVLVDVEGAEERLEHVGALFGLHVEFAFAIVGVDDVLLHAQVVEYLRQRDDEGWV